MHKWLIFCLCLAFALVNFLVFGLPHVRSWSDAQGYDAYAANILLHHNYSTDGVTYDPTREPGYPAFLAVVYATAGIHNLLAVSLAQTILVGLFAFFIYLLFAREGKERLGLLAAALVALLPSYGYYADEILTETLFTFLLVCALYLCYRVALRRGDAPWLTYCLLGAALGYGTLVREQLLFFPLFLIICYALFVRAWSPTILKKMAGACAICAVMLGSWIAYVHAQNGTFSITAGRAEVALYIRADRTELSYRELSHYAVDWVERSASGGNEDTFLYEHEYHYLQDEYAAVATTSAEVAALKKEDINIVLSRPGHYLYGNFIELMKLTYVEHDYSNYINRYVRAGMYAFVYLFFIFGLWRLWRGESRSMRTLAALSLLFIIYNWLALTPFDTIPRYNTPYLLFYILAGCAGLASARFFAGTSGAQKEF